MHKRSKSTNSGNFQDFEETDAIDGWKDQFDITIWDRREEIDKEHSLDVSQCDKFRHSYFVSHRIEKGRAETNDNIEDEKNIDDEINRLVSWNFCQICDDVFQRHGKRVENCHDQDQKIPNLLVRAHFIDNASEAF